MYDICNKTGVFEKLEVRNHKEVDDQNKVYSATNDAKKSDSKRHGNKPTRAVQKDPKDKPVEHCWYYENGFCRKGGMCAFRHPVVMCASFWNTGEYPQGGSCSNRHPVQVCIKYLNGTCYAGNNCVNQHLINQDGSHRVQSKTVSPNRNISPPSQMNVETQPGAYYNPSFVANQNVRRFSFPGPSQIAGQSPGASQTPGNQFSHPGQSGQGWHL